MSPQILWLVSQATVLLLLPILLRSSLLCYCRPGTVAVRAAAQHMACALVLIRVTLFWCVEQPRLTKTRNLYVWDML